MIRSLGCPQCLCPLEGAASPFDDAAPPCTGDLTFCVQCGTVLQYTRSLAVRRVPRREWKRFDREALELLERMRAIAPTIAPRR